MKPVFLVQQEEADLARAMEKKLLELPPSSGILFVGISVTPATDKAASLYRVWIGCHRDFDEGLMGSVVRFALREELESGIKLVVEAHRGISRAPLTKVVDPAP